MKAQKQGGGHLELDNNGNGLVRLLFLGALSPYPVGDFAQYVGGGGWKGGEEGRSGGGGVLFV